VAASLELPTQVVLGYADMAVNAVLGVDGEREAAIAVCAVGRGGSAPVPVPDLEPIAHPAEPVSRAEVTFELRRLIDEARIHWVAQPIERVGGDEPTKL
jgi:hypothetical protein